MAYGTQRFNAAFTRLAVNISNKQSWAVVNLCYILLKYNVVPVPLLTVLLVGQRKNQLNISMLILYMK